VACQLARTHEFDVSSRTRKKVFLWMRKIREPVWYLWERPVTVLGSQACGPARTPDLRSSAGSAVLKVRGKPHPRKRVPSEGESELRCLGQQHFFATVPEPAPTAFPPNHRRSCTRARFLIGPRMLGGVLWRKWSADPRKKNSLGSTIHSAGRPEPRRSDSPTPNTRVHSQPQWSRLVSTKIP